MKTLVLLGLAILTGFLMAVVYYTLTNAFDEKTPAQPQQYQIPPQFYNQYSQYYNKVRAPKLNTSGMSLASVWIPVPMLCYAIFLK